MLHLELNISIAQFRAFVKGAALFFAGWWTDCFLQGWWTDCFLRDDGRIVFLRGRKTFWKKFFLLCLPKHSRLARYRVAILLVLSLARFRFIAHRARSAHLRNADNSPPPFKNFYGRGRLLNADVSIFYFLLGKSF